MKEELEYSRLRVRMQLLVTSAMVRITFSRKRMRRDVEEGGAQAADMNGNGNSLAC